jgi:hypothetical protein
MAVRKYSLLALVLACASEGFAQEQQCAVSAAPRAISTDVRETSGLAVGRRNPNVLWTHNDSGNRPEIFAITPDGAVRARVAIEGATLTDWEDLDIGKCGSDSCIYIADIGDNAGQRRTIRIYEVVEPLVPAGSARVARTWEASYSDGPQDAEAFFRLPSGEIYVVTKGRQKSVKVYLLSQAGTNGRGVLQLVREILPRAKDERDRVTAATSSPSGQFVAIRTYRTLYIYRTTDLLANGAPRVTHSLAGLAEKQGEALTLDDQGRIWLSSEAENPRDKPTLAQLTCKIT